MTTRYQLRGHGQICAKDTGVTYTHKALAIEDVGAANGAS